MDLIKFWALWLRMQSLRAIWGAVRPAAALAGPWAYRLYDKVRCPAWVPVRGQRAFCHRRRGHRRPCITDWNTLGERAPRGMTFRTPDKVWPEYATRR